MKCNVFIVFGLASRGEYTDSGHLVAQCPVNITERTINKGMAFGLEISGDGVVI